MMEFKSVLDMKDEEINILKQNSKIVKYQQLDMKYKIILDENKNLLEKYNYLRDILSTYFFLNKERSTDY
jgi:hypothetical protein